MLEILLEIRDERAIVVADALLDAARLEHVELPDWVGALAGLTDIAYLDVVYDLMVAEAEEEGLS